MTKWKLSIPPIEQLSIWQRVILTLVIVLAVLIVLAAIDLLSGAKGQVTLVLPPSKWDERLIELDQRATEEAYIEKIKQLFGVWVREGVDNPERPMKGAAQARRAYIEIMQA